MSIFKSFSLAVYSLITNKMRSFLTMLGIIIGVAAVIILVSVVDGMTGEMTNAFSSFGTTALTVNVNNRSSTKKVEVEQMYDFVSENQNLFMGVSPNVTVAMAQLRINSEAVTSSVTGVSEQYADITKKVVTDGRFISYGEVEAKSKACVIGTYIKQEVFGGKDPLGKSIKINGVSFNVVGVLEEKGDSTQNSADNCIYIPYTTAQSMVGSKTVSTYSVGVADEKNVEFASDVLERFLTNCLGDNDYFTVTNLLEILDTVNEIIDKMKLMLVAIAGISLLVGGIGIMNIMLVSVTERTREIGIRKSLGAKKKDIMSQFVIEAGTVSGIGGIIGLVLGAAVSYWVGSLLGITALPSVSTICMSVGISVGIGILFGFLPANKAANLNPIDALRYD